MARHWRWSRYYEPEELGPEQDRIDALMPDRRYYVYVLLTDFGHYVGHTGRPRTRIREHLRGESSATAGTDPEPVWMSGPMWTREDAAKFEAALKSLRDQRSRRFKEITGLDPIPLRRSRRLIRPGRRQPAQARSGSGCLVSAVVVAAIAALAILGFLSG